MIKPLIFYGGSGLTTTGSGIWKWLLPLLLVGAGLVWYQSQPSDTTEPSAEAAAPAETVAKAPAAATPPAAVAGD